jgi:hypothetical protein
MPLLLGSSNRSIVCNKNFLKKLWKKSTVTSVAKKNSVKTIFCFQIQIQCSLSLGTLYSAKCARMKIILFMPQPVMRIHKFEFLIISKDPDPEMPNNYGSRWIRIHNSIMLVKTQKLSILMSDTLQTILHCLHICRTNFFRTFRHLFTILNINQRQL